MVSVFFAAAVLSVRRQLRQVVVRFSNVANRAPAAVNRDRAVDWGKQLFRMCAAVIIVVVSKISKTFAVPATPFFPVVPL